MLRRNALVSVLITAAMLGVTGSAMAADDKLNSAISDTLHRYADALKASDVEAVGEVYESDAVFMPPNAPPIEGAAAVKGAYGQLFKAVKLDLAFEIDEIHEFGSDWAFVRTQSKGTAQPAADKGEPRPELNKEVFLMHRAPTGQWLISRYIFSAIK